MDPDLLSYYNQELQHVREVGGEFAKEFPKIASRLGLSGFDCADPYVERLLEGFAFLAARVRLKVDAEFPRFTQYLLEMVYPHYLAPTPSMVVVRLQPDLNEGSLADGFEVKRGTALRSLIGKHEQTACEYRTAHDMSLWPLEVVMAEYLYGAGAVTQLGVPKRTGLKAGVRIRLRTTAGLKFNQISLHSLQFFLRGGGLAFHLYEQLLGNTLAVALKPAKSPAPWVKLLPAGSVKSVGFDDDHALLPYTSRSFKGYRLMQEYFAFPERFLFVQLSDLQKAIRNCDEDELDIVFLLNRANSNIKEAIDASYFELFCTPAINLFPKRTSRIHLTNKTDEYHIVPDRERPMDYEIFSVNEVLGFGTSAKKEQEFLPFYGAKKFLESRAESAYYSLHREPRLLSTKQRRIGRRSSYIGSEVFISLVDANEAPFSSGLKQLGLDTLCTNRDLPLHVPLDTGTTDFTIQTGAPVQCVKCVAGPTKPRASTAKKDTAWKFINHLSLNYLSLMDSDEKQGAAALRELLSLYGDNSDISIRKQIDGVFSIRSERAVRRMGHSGPVTFGRGLEILVRCDELAFEGGGVFLLGSILEQFFSRYSSINSFTETVISTIDRGEVMRWPVRIGNREVI